jgi:hypothetical protein
MNDTYIPLFRSLLGHRYMLSSAKLHFWIWCLLKAKRFPYRQLVGNQTVDLDIGQFVFGRKQAAAEMGMSEQNIKTLIKFFVEGEQKLTIKSTNKFSIITVIDYVSYNVPENQSNQLSNQPLTSNQPASNQQVTTIKNVDKGDKDKKESKPSSPDALRLSERLASLILSNNPTHSELSNGKKQVCIERWAKPIDTLLNRKLPAAEIEKVITWCQSDNFWKSNILSGTTLLKKFDTLSAKATASSQTHQVIGREYFLKQGGINS